MFDVRIGINLKDAVNALERVWNEWRTSDSRRERELVASCSNLDLENVQALLRDKININAHDGKGRTLLIIASSVGDDGSVGMENFHLVKLLLDCHPELEAKDHFGNTALIMASRNGAARIVEALINAGANVNAQNGRGWTGLMRAVNHSYCKTAAVFKSLLSPSAWNNLKEITNNDGDKAIDILKKNRINMDPDVYDDLLLLLN